MTQEIRDRNGMLIGRIIPSGTDKLKGVLNSNGRTVGYYDIKQDKTTDEVGRPVGRGNLLPALIYEKR